MVNMKLIHISALQLALQSRGDAESETYRSWLNTGLPKKRNSRNPRNPQSLSRLTKPTRPSSTAVLTIYTCRCGCTSSRIKWMMQRQMR